MAPQTCSSAEGDILVRSRDTVGFGLGPADPDRVSATTYALGRH
ncbi:MAG: hypothetical protein ACYCV7_00405 [Acidimicrobiales bacterium]